LSQGEFCVEEAAFCIEYFDIIRIAVVKTQAGNARIVVERLNLLCLNFKLFS